MSSDLLVRRAVAVNPSTPIEVLVMLWQDPEVRGDVESNPLWSFQPATFTLGDLEGLPSNVVQQLIKHSDPSVREIAAKAGLGDVTDWLSDLDPNVVAAYSESILRQEYPNPAVEVNEALKSCVGKVPDDLDRERPALFVRAPQEQSGTFSHLKEVGSSPGMIERKFVNHGKGLAQPTVVQTPDRTIEQTFSNPCVSGEYPQKSTEELEVKIGGYAAPERVKLGSMDDLWQRDPVSPLNVAVSHKE